MINRVQHLHDNGNGTAPAVRPEAIPDCLVGRRQWLCWRLEPRPGKRPAKVPVCPSTGRNADVTDRSHCASFAAACERRERDRLDGVGFSLFPDDGLTGLDLDGCRDPGLGELTAEAAQIVNRFDSYSELSPSGRGVRVFVGGKLPVGGVRRGAVEVYSWGRFLTVTGDHLGGTPDRVESRTDALDDFFRQITNGGEGHRTSGGIPSVSVPSLADDDLLARARRASNGAKFVALFDRGDTRPYQSPSEADLALCSALAFWTGPDSQRLDALFRASALYRPKWDSKRGGQTYGAVTIRKAILSRALYYASPTISSQTGSNLSPREKHSVVPPHSTTPPTVYVSGGQKATDPGGNIEAVLVASLPVAAGRWRPKVLALVWRLKAMARFAGADASCLAGVASRWHALAARVLGRKVSAADVQQEFRRAWALARHRVGTRPIDLIFAAVKQSPPDIDSGYRGPEFLQLAALCRELSSRSAAGQFFLSYQLAGELLGVPKRTAGRYLRVLSAPGGPMEREKPGSRQTGLASCYRWQQPFAEQTEGEKRV